ncbi:unnamed protein product [Peniophora sp. CBMAI 1063]|nr:unnamed protein product [Peniophora sp. CBMAI 1063]
MILNGFEVYLSSGGARMEEHVNAENHASSSSDTMTCSIGNPSGKDVSVSVKDLNERGNGRYKAFTATLYAEDRKIAWNGEIREDARLCLLDHALDEDRREHRLRFSDVPTTLDHDESSELEPPEILDLLGSLKVVVHWAKYETRKQSTKPAITDIDHRPIVRELGDLRARAGRQGFSIMTLGEDKPASEDFFAEKRPWGPGGELWWAWTWYEPKTLILAATFVFRHQGQVPERRMSEHRPESGLQYNDPQTQHGGIEDDLSMAGGSARDDEPLLDERQSTEASPGSRSSQSKTGDPEPYDDGSPDEDEIMNDSTSGFDGTDLGELSLSSPIPDPYSPPRSPSCTSPHLNDGNSRIGRKRKRDDSVDGSMDIEEDLDNDADTLEPGHHTERLNWLLAKKESLERELVHIDLEIAELRRRTRRWRSPSAQTNDAFDSDG